jgi:tetratricopeptide (TPR) repeat protein
MMIADFGQVYYFSRQYAKAEEFYLKANSLDENISNDRLAELYEKQKREKETFETLTLLNCNDYAGEQKSKCFDEFADTFARKGTKGIILKKLNLSLNIIADKKTPQNRIANNWYGIALSYLQLGEKEKAIDHLHRAFETKTHFEIMNFVFPFLGVTPQFDALRDEERFQALLRKINLSS